MLNWSYHSCTWYCRDAIHAVPLLARPDLTATRIAEVLARGLDAGDTLIEVRPAPEADVGRWREEFAPGWTGWQPGLRRWHAPTAPLPADMTVPYLAFIRRGA